MKSYIVSALLGASCIQAVELDSDKNLLGSGKVWNGDISGFKHGDYTSIPEIKAAQNDPNPLMTHLRKLSRG